MTTETSSLTIPDFSNNVEHQSMDLGIIGSLNELSEVQIGTNEESGSVQDFEPEIILPDETL